MLLKDFKTKSKAQSYLKRVLNTYLDVGSTVRDGDDHWELLMDIIDNHYDSINIVGVGIHCIDVVKCKVNYRNRNFRVIRLDGSSRDFSYKKGVSGFVPSSHSKVVQGFRKAVTDYIIAYKKDFFKNNKDYKGYVVCNVTGLKMLYKDCHVDHVYPKTFENIVYTFINDNGICINTIPLTTYTGNNVIDILDDELKNQFYDYHRKEAKLQCVYWRANLQGKKTLDFINNYN